MDIRTTIITAKIASDGNAIYELRKNGKVIYQFCNEIQDDGSEIQSGVEHYYEKAEKIIDSNRVNSIE